MGAKSERRSLYYADNQEFEPSISVDVNEYLIENWPTLTLKQRTSVWTLCQNDEDFDFESIYDQIDGWVFQLAEDDPNVYLGDDVNEDENQSSDELSDEEYEDEDDSLQGYLIVDVVSYLLDKYPNMTEQQIFDVSDHMNSDESFSWDVIYTYMDAYTKQYACEIDNTIDLTESLDESA